MGCERGKASDSAGRGVEAGEKIVKAQFVCEYKTSEVYDAKERPEMEARHVKNGLGCYIVETKHAIYPRLWPALFQRIRVFPSPGALH